MPSTTEPGPAQREPGHPTKAVAAPTAEDHNLVVVVGVLRRPPEHRVLPDGRSVAELEVTARAGDVASTVPVSWVVDPVPTWPEGERVVVVGQVRRRFYRAGGATISRTDVLAATVLPARQRKRASAVLAAALAALR